jgi:predicted ATPase with chaperone activity
MRSQQLVEIKGMVGNDYNFTLSAAGKQLAGERFQVSQYAGACPVSLKEYHAATKAQAAKVLVDRRALRQAFSDLVVSDRMLDQLGPAIISQSSIFVYGPTGNGKTSLAERMLRVYQDAIMIPHAVEVDNQIISVYDPVVHHPLEMDDEDVDPRWLMCRRPCIIVGGELIPSMLELRLDESSGIYAAPLQMKANNGILLIDDFGRQLMSPRDLLNRWIVPLDRRVDYLTLRYGVKFQIPFELMVVFSTNLEPADLADEAFLRRIHNKIFVDAVDPVSFDQIFERVVKSRSIQAEPDSAEYLRKLCLREGRTELRACYPADICNILASIGKYEGRPPVMTKPELERATALYFAKN